MRLYARNEREAAALAAVIVGSAVLYAQYQNWKLLKEIREAERQMTADKSRLQRKLEAMGLTVHRI